MTTALYSRQNNVLEGIAASHSTISASFGSEIKPDKISVLVISMATRKVQANSLATGIGANAYYLNRFGDEYDCCDELGFESSYMGPRADQNHIF